MPRRTPASTSEITPAPPSIGAAKHPPLEITYEEPPRAPPLRHPVQTHSQPQMPGRGNDDVGISVGWICFFCGFLCLVPWLFGFLLSFISENKNDKRVRYWNLAAFLIVSAIYVVVWILYD